LYDFSTGFVVGTAPAIGTTAVASVKALGMFVQGQLPSMATCADRSQRRVCGVYAVWRSCRAQQALAAQPDRSLDQEEVGIRDGFPGCRLL
jgi:hypothetical protein